MRISLACTRKPNIPASLLLIGRFVHWSASLLMCRCGHCAAPSLEISSLILMHLQTLLDEDPLNSANFLYEIWSGLLSVSIMKYIARFTAAALLWGFLFETTSAVGPKSRVGSLKSRATSKTVHLPLHSVRASSFRANFYLFQNVTWLGPQFKKHACKQWAFKFLFRLVSFYQFRTQ